MFFAGTQLAASIEATPRQSGTSIFGKKASGMLKKVVFWSVVILPSVMVGAFALLIAIAAYEIHIIRDAEAYARAAVPFQKVARDVYTRQRSIWQAQSHCIVFDEVLFYKPRPGKCEFNNIEFSTVLTFDNRGFRKTSPPMQQGRDRPHRGRIIVLGDSQAMGWGVQDEETFASLLASEHGFEVFNLAVSSYGTARELLRLRKEFDLQKGDTVVIQYHPNDAKENFWFVNRGALRPHSPSDLGNLAHFPQRYEVPEVSTSIALHTLGDFKRKLFGNYSVGGDLAETFLAVIDHFPELAHAKVVVCEVPDFGEATSFTDKLQRLAGDRLTVLEPVWETSDFYRLDAHLNSIGHHKLANLIAATILSDQVASNSMPL
jgi:hypothetical protein